jgi:uncharacterized protein
VHVAELWRYPVKSLAGERLESVAVREDGFPGDRAYRVVDGLGKQVTARTKPGLVALSGADLEGARAGLADAAGADARIEPASQNGDGGHFFDESPLLVATDGAIAEFGRDGRRLRPNLVIGGVDGLAEREWEGRALRIGHVVIGAVDLRGRCVMTTYDPDSGVQDPEVLKAIVRRFGGSLALNARVLVPGTIREGDRVELLAGAAVGSSPDAVPA